MVLLGCVFGSEGQKSRPPIYSGTTGLTIRPKERRVLRLPVVELGNGDKLETVVLLWYTTSDESGEKSSLEIE
jgi:hypothetical protein